MCPCKFNACHRKAAKFCITTVPTTPGFGNCLFPAPPAPGGQRGSSGDPGKGGAAPAAASGSHPSPSTRGQAGNGGSGSKWAPGMAPQSPALLNPAPPHFAELARVLRGMRESREAPGSAAGTECLRWRGWARGFFISASPGLCVPAAQGRERRGRGCPLFPWVHPGGVAATTQLSMEARQALAPRAPGRAGEGVTPSTIPGGDSLLLQGWTTSSPARGASAGPWPRDAGAAPPPELSRSPRVPTCSTFWGTRSL